MDLGVVGLGQMNYDISFAQALWIVLDNAKLSLTRLEKVAGQEKLIMVDEVDTLYRRGELSEEKWRPLRDSIERLAVSKGSISGYINNNLLPSRLMTVMLIRAIKRYYDTDLVEMCNEVGIPPADRPKFTKKHAESLMLLAGHALPQQIQRAATWTQELHAQTLPDAAGPTRHSGQYQRKKTYVEPSETMEKEKYQKHSELGPDTGPIQAFPPHLLRQNDCVETGAWYS
jgi:hypothetical protein